MSSALDHGGDVDFGPVSIPGSAPEPSRDELEAMGYVIKLGGSEDEYRRDPCKFPSLNYSIAKVIARECAEDGWRMHPRGDATMIPSTDAMDEGTVVDKLLTGDFDYSKLEVSRVWTWQGSSKGSARKPKVPDELYFSDWQGLRVIDADSYSTRVAQTCRDDAEAKGLIPILQCKLKKAVQTANEYKVRLELAGIDLLEGQRQVPMYWVDFADDGTPVQCRGLIDQLVGLKIRDLKACATLNRRLFARQMFDLGYHIQAAAYTSGLERVTGEFGRVSFEWALVRKGELPAAARRKPTGELLTIGHAEWRYAINTWAQCLRDGLWPGYEMAGLEYVEAEPWMMAQVEGL